MLSNVHDKKSNKSVDIGSIIRLFSDSKAGLSCKKMECSLKLATVRIP